MSMLAYIRDVAFDVDPVEVEEKIDRPKHQFNLTVGAGMTQIDIDEPFVGDITPTAIHNQEIFLSLSYLNRINRNWGIEAGIQGAYQSQKIAYYFREGEYGLPKSEYGEVHTNAYEAYWELFTNIHFFLPLNQRSELDIYGGFYAIRPFSAPGGVWGSRAGTLSADNRDLTLIRTDVSGNTGLYNGGRIKLGVNYNFLTNRLNNVGVGIAYMHQVDNVVEGSYRMIQSTEEAAIAGNLRSDPSGFKVQVTYGFGMKRLPWNKQSPKKVLKNKSPWYIGVRYGFISYKFNDDLTKDLVKANYQRTQSFYVGHYISQKIAYEFGLEFSEFTFSTPLSESNFVLQSQRLLSVPFAMRYNLIQTDRLTPYVKGTFSTDFRLNYQSKFNRTGTGYITDKDKLLLSTGIETGIDFRVIAGLNLGIVGRYNHAFRRTAKYQYPIVSDQNEIEFQDINLRNTYVAWGIELKYKFNR